MLACEELMKKNLNPVTIVHFFNAACRHDIANMKRFIIKYMERGENVFELLEAKIDWGHLCPSAVRELLGYRPDERSAAVVSTSVTKWLEGMFLLCNSGFFTKYMERSEGTLDPLFENIHRLEYLPVEISQLSAC